PLLREAVRACCAAEAFATAAGQMRSAQEQQADLALNLLPALSRLAPGTASRLFGEIIGRFFGEADQTRFGLMNAVTAAARDTRDPELRWGLEELGGGIAAGITPEPLPKEPAGPA